MALQSKNMKGTKGGAADTKVIVESHYQRHSEMTIMTENGDKASPNDGNNNAVIEGDGKATTVFAGDQETGSYRPLSNDDSDLTVGSSPGEFHLTGGNPTPTLLDEASKAEIVAMPVVLVGKTAGNSANKNNNDDSESEDEHEHVFHIPFETRVVPKANSGSDDSAKKENSAPQPVAAAGPKKRARKTTAEVLAHRERDKRARAADPSIDGSKAIAKLERHVEKKIANPTFAAEVTAQSRACHDKKRQQQQQQVNHGAPTSSKPKKGGAKRAWAAKKEYPKFFNDVLRSGIKTLLSAREGSLISMKAIMAMTDALLIAFETELTEAGFPLEMTVSGPKYYEHGLYKVFGDYVEKIKAKGTRGQHRVLNFDEPGAKKASAAFCNKHNATGLANEALSRKVAQVVLAQYGKQLREP